MIIKKQPEILENLRGTHNIELDHIVDRAMDMMPNWKDHRVLDTASGFPIKLTPDLQVEFNDNYGNGYRQDISEYAFTQMCSKVGVPASYIMKCFDREKPDLAIQNFYAWANDVEMGKNLLVRSYDGICRAVLTDRYNVFDSSLVLEAIRDSVSSPQYSGRYEANQAYLSEDRLHIRFVDFNGPLQVGGDRLFPGFTVSSSDIGSGSLCIKYFLYRFACKNGIVAARGGGILFRQTHLGEFMDTGKALFMNALDKIEDLNTVATQKIQSSMNRKLFGKELEIYLEKARKELHLGKTGEENVRKLMDSTYGYTMWGLINSITEDAQRYNMLDNRMASESYGWNLLMAA
ncbi:MAG: DUF932 domain-containing protein [Oscillospiraceae bacterium]|nr:DUF932 domain-containing protein [Oscillospiraceae bacterium]